MNILNIAMKEMKSSLREPRTFLFMMAFPIVLMLILGTALSNAFSSSTLVGDLKLLYNNQADNKQLIQAWQIFSTEIEQQGIIITPLSSTEANGVEDISNNKYAAYVELSNEGLKYYGSSKRMIESNIIQGMLTAFADRYNLATSTLTVDPSKAEAILGNTDWKDDLIHETSLDPNKTPGSIDYYAIAMTTMIALYASLSGIYLFRGERTRNTAIRLMASPASKGELFTGKVLACTITNLLFVLIVVLFSKFAFKAYWGDHYGMVFLVLASEVILSVSLGLGLSYLFKGETARSIVMIFTQIASFVGGAYSPIQDTESFMGFITNLSPIGWANKALMNIIYADDLIAALPVIGVNLAFATTFLVISNVIMRKREAI
ncbi:ABC transporter permease [Cohnella sp. WQ 127256]|uniref:ABC transporter permease n=1 Tax=Cohnella sp. WQ 127256 TaxID=2938790 RepID=UPI002118F0A5